MNRKIFSSQFLLSDIAILSYLALFKLILHILFHGNYGYFRDELYYIACSDHLAFGYVDHPPLSIFVLDVVRVILGDSLHAIRFLTAVVGALVVFLTGMIVRKLGGGRFAQILGALAIIVAPCFLGQSTYFSMNALDILFWTLAAYIVILIVKKNTPKLWLLFGGIVGLGLLNKYSMLFFGFGLVIGLLLTSHRKNLLNKWFWLASLMALVIILPNIIWEITYDFPYLEFKHNATLYRVVQVSTLDFFLGQLILINPVNTPIWLLGLYYYFFHKEGKKYRLLGWMYIIILPLMVYLKTKIYHLTPIYPMFLASGALIIEKFILNYNWNWVKSVISSILIISGIIAAPFAMPILPVETFIKYQNLSGFTPPREERSDIGVLPQHFADRFGWENMVATVARVYKNLSLEERSKCAILVRNCGEAGAIDFFGKKYNLPSAICGNNNYWLWGPGDATGELVIVLGSSLEDLSQYFKEVEQAEIVKCKYCLPVENNRPVFICRNLKVTMKELWPQLKRYI